MSNNEKKPQSTAVKNMQDLAKSTASGMQSLAKKTAKGAQNIAKSTAESVKSAQAKKKAEAEKKPAAPKKKPAKKTTKKKSSGINLKFIGGALLRKMAFGGAKQLGSNAFMVGQSWLKVAGL